MEKRKNILNTSFEIITIIFFIWMSIKAKYIVHPLDIENLSINKLFMLGFILFIFLKRIDKKNIGIGIFIGLNIVSIILSIKEIVNIGDYELIFQFKKVTIIECIQKIILTIVLIIDIKAKEKSILDWIMLVITFISNFVILYTQIYIYSILWVIISTYIAIDVLFIYREFTKKSFAYVILLINIYIIFLILYEIFTLWIPKYKLNKVADKIENIDSIQSSVPKIVNNRIVNGRRSVKYKVSENLKKTNEIKINNNQYEDYYLFNDIKINITISEMAVFLEYNSDKFDKKFNIGNNIYYVSIGAESIYLCTQLKGNIIYSIQINYFDNIHLTDEELINIKPFFEVDI